MPIKSPQRCPAEPQPTLAAGFEAGEVGHVPPLATPRKNAASVCPPSRHRFDMCKGSPTRAGPRLPPDPVSRSPAPSARPPMPSQRCRHANVPVYVAKLDKHPLQLTTRICGANGERYACLEAARKCKMSIDMTADRIVCWSRPRDLAWSLRVSTGEHCRGASNARRIWPLMHIRSHYLESWQLKATQSRTTCLDTHRMLVLPRADATCKSTPDHNRVEH